MLTLFESLLGATNLAGCVFYFAQIVLTLHYLHRFHDLLCSGVRESNSRFFDLCLGWQGLLVEPNKRIYERMEKLRPNAHHLGVAPSCNSTSDVFKFPDHEYTNAVSNEEGASIEIHVQIDVIISESVNRLEGTAERAEAVRSFLAQNDFLVLQSVTIDSSDVFLHKSVCNRYNFPECQ